MINDPYKRVCVDEENIEDVMKMLRYFNSIKLPITKEDIEFAKAFQPERVIRYMRRHQIKTKC
jgi:hypothetical protein